MRRLFRVHKGVVSFIEAAIYIVLSSIRNILPKQNFFGEFTNDFALLVPESKPILETEY